MSRPLDDLSGLKERKSPKLVLSKSTKQVVLRTCIASWIMTACALFYIKTIIVSGAIALVVGFLGFLSTQKGEPFRYIAVSWMVMVAGGYVAIESFGWKTNQARIPITMAMGGYSVLLSVSVMILLRWSRSA